LTTDIRHGPAQLVLEDGERLRGSGLASRRKAVKRRAAAHYRRRAERHSAWREKAIDRAFSRDDLWSTRAKGVMIESGKGLSGRTDGFSGSYRRVMQVELPQSYKRTFLNRTALKASSPAAARWLGLPYVSPVARSTGSKAALPPRFACEIPTYRETPLGVRNALTALACDTMALLSGHRSEAAHAFHLIER
jgi:hypothetical protein